MKLVRILGVITLLAGCRSVAELHDEPDGSVQPGTPDGPAGSKSDGPPAAAGSIRALLMSPPAANSQVSVQEVVVVGRVTSSNNAYAWIQDAGGGPYSGIQIYCQKSSCTAYDTIDKLQPGEVLDIAGTFDEYMGSAEIKGPVITKKGTTLGVVATPIAAAKVNKQTDSTSVEFKQWNQVLVRVNGPLTATDVTAAQFEAACPSGGSADGGAAGKQYRGFEVTAGTDVVNVGLGFYDTLGYCIPGCGFGCDSEVKEGDGYDYLQGVVRVVDGFVRIDPVANEDMPLEGSTPAADAGVSDAPTSSEPDAGPAPMIDAGAPSEPDAGGVIGNGTVKSITMNLPADGTSVAITSAVVVGVELRSTGAQAYIQDNGGGEYSGMLVYCNTATCKPLLEKLQPGDVIDVSGSFKNFVSGTANTPELVEPFTVTPKGLFAEPAYLEVAATAVATTVAPDAAAFKPLNGVFVRVSSAATVASDHVVDLDSGSCTGGNKFRNAWEVSFGGANAYVFSYFNDTLSACISGGCAPCNAPVATADTFDFVSGVARVEKGKVVISPVEDIDVPRSGSVRAILSDLPAANTTVSLADAVVVAHNAAPTKNSVNIYVQDPGGGRWSGIQIFCSGTTGAACVATAQTLVPGDVVTVTGAFSLFQTYTPEILNATTLTKTGATAPVVATAAIPELLRHDLGPTSRWYRPFDQVLVKVNGPIVMSAVSVPDSLMGTCGTGLTDWRGFSVMAGTQELFVGDLFAPALTLCQPDDCQACANPVTMADTFDFAQGVARISKNNQIQIAPRNDADIPRTP